MAFAFSVSASCAARGARAAARNEMGLVANVPRGDKRCVGENKRPWLREGCSVASRVLVVVARQKINRRERRICAGLVKLMLINNNTYIPAVFSG